MVFVTAAQKQTRTDDDLRRAASWSPTLSQSPTSSVLQHLPGPHAAAGRQEGVAGGISGKGLVTSLISA